MTNQLTTSVEWKIKQRTQNSSILISNCSPPLRVLLYFQSVHSLNNQQSVRQTSNSRPSTRSRVGANSWDAVTQSPSFVLSRKVRMRGKKKKEFHLPYRGSEKMEINMRLHNSTTLRFGLSSLSLLSFEDKLLVWREREKKVPEWGNTSSWLGWAFSQWSLPSLHSHLATRIQCHPAKRRAWRGLGSTWTMLHPLNG